MTTERNSPGELRINLSTSGSMSQNYFDFSSLDFNPQLISGDFIADGPIEQGFRYVLQLWQAGNTLRADGNVFDPEILRTNRYTAILYTVFN